MDYNLLEKFDFCGLVPAVPSSTNIKVSVTKLLGLFIKGILLPQFEEVIFSEFPKLSGEIEPHIKLPEIDEGDNTLSSIGLKFWDVNEAVLFEES